MTGVWLDAAIGGLFGLMVGSFLNVVIYRLPKMMERQWAAECAELSGKPADDTAPAFNLMVPRSRCGNCGHAIAWHENIPVLSYLLLRGQCSACGVKFGLRYPMVEMACAALFFFCVWHWGMSWTALAWCGFSAALLALGFIDWDTTLLPDDITLPLLWAGLLASSIHVISIDLRSAIWGAAAGYMVLWTINFIYMLVAKKVGMANGDFKLLAALGAWFGFQDLIAIMLMASVIGSIVGIGLKVTGGLREGRYIPFGPFLAGAGLSAMLFTPSAILHTIGL